MSSTINCFPNLSDTIYGSESEGTKIDWRIDKILQWAYKILGEKEFATAVAEFHNLGGKIFYDDPIYYSRTNYFLDFFIFERPITLGKRSKSPFLHFIATNFFIDNFTKEEKAMFLDLRYFSHSIFKIRKLKKQEMILENLLSNKNFAISSEDNFDWTQGFQKDGILQGFIYPSKKGNKLSSGVIIHPQETSRMVTKFIKKRQKWENTSKHKYLMLLAKIQLESFRHKHRPPRIVYHSRLLQNS